MPWRRSWKRLCRRSRNNDRAFGRSGLNPLVHDGGLAAPLPRSPPWRHAPQLLLQPMVCGSRNRSLGWFSANSRRAWEDCCPGSIAIQRSRTAPGVLDSGIVCVRFRHQDAARTLYDATKEVFYLHDLELKDSACSTYRFRPAGSVDPCDSGRAGGHHRGSRASPQMIEESPDGGGPDVGNPAGFVESLPSQVPGLAFA
jgi:hypothetical protein